MKRNVSTSNNTEARTTDMTQLGKMFVYIALLQLQDSMKCPKWTSADITMWTDGAKKLVDNLVKLGVVKIDVEPSDEEVPGGTVRVDWTYASITKKGANLVPRYFAACADDLRAGRFGKFTWSKRTKFHKEVLARIA